MDYIAQISNLQNDVTQTPSKVFQITIRRNALFVLKTGYAEHQHLDY